MLQHQCGSKKRLGDLGTGGFDRTPSTAITEYAATPIDHFCSSFARLIFGDNLMDLTIAAGQLQCTPQ